MGTTAPVVQDKLVKSPEIEGPINEYDLRSVAVRIAFGAVTACMGLVVNVAPYTAGLNVTVYV